MSIAVIDFHLNVFPTIKMEIFNLQQLSFYGRHTDDDEMFTIMLSMKWSMKRDWARDYSAIAISTLINDTYH